VLQRDLFQFGRSLRLDLINHRVNHDETKFRHNSTHLLANLFLTLLPQLLVRPHRYTLVILDRLYLFRVFLYYDTTPSESENESELRGSTYTSLQLRPWLRPHQCLLVFFWTPGPISTKKERKTRRECRARIRSNTYRFGTIILNHGWFILCIINTFVIASVLIYTFARNPFKSWSCVSKADQKYL